MAAIAALVARVREAGGSDLHLSAGRAPMMRRNGRLMKMNGDAPVAQAQLDAWLREIAPAAHWTSFEQSGDDAFEFSVDELTRCRVSCNRQLSGTGVICRLIPQTVPSLDELGLPPVFKELAQQRGGLVLVTGGSGSGKTTTVAALLREIAETRTIRILTVEPSVEFSLRSEHSVFVQRELGAHTQSVPVALERASDGYDVVFCGELQSVDTLVAAVKLAEAGVLVIGTLRTGSCVKTLEHIIGAFPSAQQPWIRTMLSNSLRAVSAQVLVPKLDGSGRCVANELLICTTGVASAIREGYTAKLNTMIQAGGQDGMILLDDALMKKVEAKIISPADAVPKALDKQRFLALIKPPPVEASKPAPAAAPPPQRPAAAGTT